MVSHWEVDTVDDRGLGEVLFVGSDAHLPELVRPKLHPRRARCARPPDPWVRRFPGGTIRAVAFAAWRGGPDQGRQEVDDFLGGATDVTPPIESGKNAARAPRFPLLQAGAQRVYEGVSRIPGVGSVLKSMPVART